jgi:tetratricopeptide (TPR) repeat protein
VILQQLQRLDEALADFNQCLKLNPQHSNALSNRANVWKAKGLWQAAEEDFDRALALNPKQAETWNNRGNLRVAQGDWHGALADYTQSLTLKPTAAAYHNRGLVWQHLGKLSEAEQDFVESQKLCVSHTAKN